MTQPEEKMIKCEKEDCVFQFVAGKGGCPYHPTLNKSEEKKCCVRCEKDQSFRDCEDCPCHTPQLPKESEEKKLLDRNMNQIIDNKKLSSMPIYISKDEDWIKGFKSWYTSLYPACWKAHKVIEKIEEIRAVALQEGEAQGRKEVKEIIKEKRASWALGSYHTNIAGGAMSALDEILASLNKDEK